MRFQDESGHLFQYTTVKSLIELHTQYYQQFYRYINFLTRQRRAAFFQHSSTHISPHERLHDQLSSANHHQTSAINSALRIQQRAFI
ncbi:hypothetical protein EYC84_001245 [Monilinia fructicola]|uniref:Uncharacterized protein n=1 Tax=Monilinia fructicola TaxID=38448 RepID=A0A5M9JK39_MONFR|nr:hypothetical protein EYC84_001245 [Monilinia fructicola]